MNTAIIFLSIVIILLSVMLVIRLDIYFDMWRNIIQIKIYVMNIKLFTITINILGLYYEVNNGKKRKKLHLILTEEEKYLLREIKANILDKLYYDKITFSANIGMGDASYTANIISIVYLIVLSLEMKIKNQNSDSDFEYTITPEFLTKKVILTSSVKVYFTIFDMIFATIMSFYKRGRYAKKIKK